MTKNTTDLRNELIGLMSEFNIWCLCDNDECVKSQNFNIAVDDLLALISNREKLARMDESNFIALVCPVKDCMTAIVSPRELSKVGDEITDPTEATSQWMACPKHDQEGDYGVFFDKDGNEVSYELPATLRKELEQSIKDSK